MLVNANQKEKEIKGYFNLFIHKAKNTGQSSTASKQIKSPRCDFVGSMEAPSKAFLLFFVLPDWLKLNHLKSRMECGFSHTFRAIFVAP